MSECHIVKGYISNPKGKDDVASRVSDNYPSNNWRRVMNVLW